MTFMYFCSRDLSVSIIVVSAGNTLSSSANTDAILIAVGNVSLELCDILTSSFG